MPEHSPRILRSAPQAVPPQSVRPKRSRFDRSFQTDARAKPAHPEVGTASGASGRRPDVRLEWAQASSAETASRQWSLGTRVPGSFLWSDAAGGTDGRREALPGERRGDLAGGARGDRVGGSDAGRDGRPEVLRPP